MLACVVALIFSGVALVTMQSMQSKCSVKELQDPDCVGQLFVGPDDQGYETNDYDFVHRGGRLVYMNLYITDPFDEAPELDEARPTELTDSFITISRNGEAFIRKMPIHSLPSKTKLDLSRALDNSPMLQPLDILSIEITGEENMYRSAGLGYGVIK